MRADEKGVIAEPVSPCLERDERDLPLGDTRQVPRRFGRGMRLERLAHRVPDRVVCLRSGGVEKVVPSVRVNVGVP